MLRATLPESTMPTKSPWKLETDTQFVQPLPRTARLAKLLSFARRALRSSAAFSGRIWPVLAATLVFTDPAPSYNSRRAFSVPARLAAGLSPRTANLASSPRSRPDIEPFMSTHQPSLRSQITAGGLALVASAGLVAVWLLLARESASAISDDTSAAPPPTPQIVLPSVSKDEFYRRELAPLIDKARASNRASADKSLVRLHQEFDRFRTGIPGFVDDVSSWRTRFGIIRRLGRDKWQNFWKAGDDADSEEVKNYMVAKFERHILAPDELQTAVEASLGEFKDDVAATRNRLLAEMNVALTTADMKLDFAKPDFVVVSAGVRSLHCRSRPERCDRFAGECDGQPDRQRRGRVRGGATRRAAHPPPGGHRSGHCRRGSGRGRRLVDGGQRGARRSGRLAGRADRGGGWRWGRPRGRSGGRLVGDRQIQNQSDRAIDRVIWTISNAIWSTAWRPRRIDPRGSVSARPSTARPTSSTTFKHRRRCERSSEARP